MQPTITIGCLLPGLCCQLLGHVNCQLYGVAVRVEHALFLQARSRGVTDTQIGCALGQGLGDWCMQHMCVLAQRAENRCCARAAMHHRGSAKNVYRWTGWCLQAQLGECTTAAPLPHVHVRSGGGGAATKLTGDCCLTAHVWHLFCTLYFCIPYIVLLYTVVAA